MKSNFHLESRSTYKIAKLLEDAIIFVIIFHCYSRLILSWQLLDFPIAQ